jgi:RNA recognition motif-containing protein
VQKVQKAQIMRDPHTKDPRGFGFVTMNTAEEADAATAALNATDLQGKMISIERVCFYIYAIRCISKLSILTLIRLDVDVPELVSC